MSDHPHRPGAGGRIGPRLADLTARAMTSHLYKSKDVRARIHAAGLDQFWHGVNRELAGTIGPLFGQLAKHPDVHPDAVPMLEFLAAQPGEGSALIGTAASAIGYGGGILTVVNDYLAPGVQEFLKLNPRLLLPADAWIGAAVKRFLTPEQAIDALSRQGINGDMARWYLSSQLTYPDIGTAFELRRRNIIGDQDLRGLLERLGYPDDLLDRLMPLAFVPIQPADAALMVLKGIVQQETGRGIAAASGVPAEDFDLLVLANGEPPGPEQLGEAFRRGLIQRARYEHGIRESRIRDEWIDVLDKLRFAPMDTSQAVDAVVQNHLTDAQGAKVAELNGLEPQFWPILVRTAGEPIARGEALELLNRGQMTQGEVEQAIRESRVKDKYIGKILELRRRLPPERSIVSMLSHGAIDHETALRLLMELGFDRAIAEAFVKTGTAQRTGGARHLAAGTIAELYADAGLSRDDAVKMLEALGWPAHDAELELHVAELRREHTFRQSAATRIGTDYVDRLIDRSSCSAYLEHIGLPATQRDQLLELWDLERAARRKRLTEAQVHSAFKKHVIDLQDAHGRLVAMGYDDADATILLEL